MAYVKPEDIVRMGYAMDKLALKNRRDMYEDNGEYIVKQELESQFHEDTAKRLKFLVSLDINLMKLVVRETCSLYKDPATRKAVIGEAAKGAAAKEDARYKEIIEKSSMDLIMREAQRYTRAMRHMLIKVTPRNGLIDYDLIGFDNAEIYTDPEDWKKIVGFSYCTGLEYPQTGDLTKISKPAYRSKWLYLIEGKLVVKYKVTGGFNNEKYERIEEYSYLDPETGEPTLPIVLTYLTFPVFQLTNFHVGSDLYDATLNFYIQLVMHSELMKYTTWPQPYAIVPNEKAMPDATKTGPGVGQKVIDSTGTAKMGVLDTTSDIMAVWTTIMERAKMGIAAYGISPSRFTLTGTPATGISLKMDSRGLEEIRNEDRIHFTAIEKELFRVTRVVNNAEFPKNLIDVKATLEIDYAETDYPDAPAEQIAIETHELSHNLTTPAKLLMRRNPDLDIDDATAEIEQNKVANGQASTGADALTGALVNHTSDNQNTQPAETAPAVQ